jgi:hypothetical protein
VAAEPLSRPCRSRFRILDVNQFLLMNIDVAEDDAPRLVLLWLPQLLSRKGKLESRLVLVVAHEHIGVLRVPDVDAPDP